MEIAEKYNDVVKVSLGLYPIDALAVEMKSGEFPRTIEVVDVDKVPKTTVTVYPDKTKALDKLDIQLPALSAGYKRTPKLENFTLEDVKKAFSRYQPLPLGKVGKTEIDYEGRHLFTNEIIEKMKIQLPLLQSGIGAISFYMEEIEKLTSLRGTHQVLAPLIQTFL